MTHILCTFGTHAQLEFKRQDCWIGVFWQDGTVFKPPSTKPVGIVRTLWICILPMLPIRIRYCKQHVWEDRHGDCNEHWRECIMCGKQEHHDY